MLCEIEKNALKKGIYIFKNFLYLKIIFYRTNFLIN